MKPEAVAQAMIKAMRKKQKTLILTRQGRLTVLLNKLANAFMDRLVFNHMNKEPDSPLREKPKN
jgi:dehydrogenase/reductase SDR family protein 7B